MEFIYPDRHFQFQRTMNIYCLFAFIFMSISCSSQEKFIENNVLKVDKLPKDMEAFERLVWSKSKENTLILNKDNLIKIYRNTKSSEDEYFSFLRSYASSLTTKERKIAKELSFSERAYVIGHVIEYLYKCRKKFKNDDPFKNSKFVYRILAPWDTNDYNREFKMHDYYGLELLKKHHLKYYKYFPDYLYDTSPSKKTLSD